MLIGTTQPDIIILVIMTVYVMFEKKTNTIVNIDKEKYEINHLHVNSCYVNM